MRNPVTWLKRSVDEAVRSGREGLAMAERQAGALDGLAQRVEALSEQAAQLPALLQAIEALRGAAEHQGGLLEGQGQAIGALRGLLDGQGQAIGALQGALDGQSAALATGLEAMAGRLQAIEALVTPPPEPPAPRYSGLDELDRKLEAYLDFDGGYFVELGANDGVTQSNTLYFEKHRGWRGVLVEPTPHNFLRCLANRSERTRCFCCACTAFDYPDRFVEIAFSNLMSTPIGLDSDIADPIAHAETGRRFLAPTDRVFTFGALARPLNGLLVEAGAPAVIDLLSLDVEGAELEVLKGIDHAAFRFRYICVESRDLGRISAYLAGQGYGLVRTLTHHDHLFRDLGGAGTQPD